MTKKEKEAIGNRLYALREEYAKKKGLRKISQVKFAEELGIPVPDTNSPLSKLENGHQTIKTDQLMAYSKGCGVTTDWILKGDSGKDSTIDQEEKPGTATQLTYSKVVTILRSLINSFTLSVKHGKVDTDAAPYTVDKDVLCIDDPILDYMLKTYKQFDGLLDNGAIQQTIYDSWEKAFLSSFDGQLLNFDNFTVSMNYEDIMHRLPNHDMAKAYQKLLTAVKAEENRAYESSPPDIDCRFDY